MPTKAKKPATPKPKVYPRKDIPCPCDNRGDVDAAGQAFAKVVTSPAVAAHRVIQAANPQSLRDEIDVPGMLAVLNQQATAVNRGDLSQAEAMLMNQATALQSLFTHLVEQGVRQSLMPNIDGFMRLALRAQSQCRATLETLATIKNPPIVYARQANVTSGPQQINNGTAATSRGREIENEQTKQSGPELLPDARASQVASRVNPSLETLGKIDRAEVNRG
jgi:hypothetical protein